MQSQSDQLWWQLGVASTRSEQGADVGELESYDPRQLGGGIRCAVLTTVCAID